MINRSIARDVTQGSLSLITLLVLVIGTPWLLWSWMDSPVPTASDIEALRALIDTGTIDDTAFFRVLAWAAWMLWGVVIMSTGIEALAVARGGVARSLRVIGPVQVCVARLVATASLVIAGVQARPVAAPPDLLRATGAIVADRPSVLTGLAGMRSQIAVETATATREYTVSRRDNLWSIAQRELGAGERWVDIAALNQGRVQPDGSVFDADGLLQPGWVLVLPDDTSSEFWGEREQNSTGSIEEITVVAGDTLWDLADDHLGDPLRWPELFELNRDRPQPDGRRLLDPNCIDIDWTIQLPTTETRADANASERIEPTELPDDLALGTVTSLHPQSSSVPEPTSSETVPPQLGADGFTHGDLDVSERVSVITGPVLTSPPTTHQHGEPADSSSGAREVPDLERTVAVGAGILLLATGVVLAINRWRRRMVRTRLPRRNVQLSSPMDPEREMELRRTADPLTTTWAHRIIAECRRVRRDRSGQVVGSRLHEAGLEVLLDVVDRDPIAPWVQGSSGTSWYLDASEGVAMAHDVALSTPALVSLGYDHGEVLCDLEVLGWLSCAGAASEQFIDTMATTVVVAPESEGARVIRLDRAALNEHAVLVREAIAHAHDVDTLLRRIGCATTAEARVQRVADDLSPIVVVVDDTVDVLQRDDLREAVGGGGRGLVVLARSDTEAEWVAIANEDSVLLPRLDLRLRRDASLAAVAVVAADAIGRDAAVPDLDGTKPEDDARAELVVGEWDPDVPPFEPHPEPEDEREGAEYLRPVELEGKGEVPSGGDATSEGASTAATVEVRVLGPVEVIGSHSPLDRRSTEFVAFLALQRDGAREEQIKTALWPDRVPASSSWTNRVSKTRKALGASTRGALHLPHITTGGVYRLGAGVTTDVARVSALLERSDHEDATTAVRTLETALESVRGAPFSTSSGYDWAFVSGHVAHAEAVCADVAHRLAELYLERDDTSAALRAVQRGLIASPCNEVLYRDRMLAHDRAGNPEGVEAAMRDLARAIESDDPEFDVHPETLRLYQELRRNGVRRAG